MTTKLDIWNRALTAVGAAGKVSEEDENSREADLCRLWYDEVVSVIQEGAWWPALRAEASLTDQAEDDAALFIFNYALPEGFLRAWRLRSGLPFEYAKRLQTNDPSPYLIYSEKNADPDDWNPAQSRATAYGLASKLTVPINGNVELARNMEAQANYLLLEARSVEANKQQNNYDTLPDWLEARQGGGVPTSRYMYPIGAFFGTYGSPEPSSWMAYPRAAT